jgi:hypothetical protein
MATADQQTDKQRMISLKFVQRMKQAESMFLYLDCLLFSFHSSFHEFENLVSEIISVRVRFPRGYHSTSFNQGNIERGAATESPFGEAPIRKLLYLLQQVRYPLIGKLFQG